ncbi:MAG TPA: hypothetical protein VEW71_03005 [Allosphingosinicella sp.]|nr:hypothetical protein [Allosphingosinicella sp.]
MASRPRRGWAVAAVALALAGCATTAPAERDFVPGYPGVDYLPAERMAGELTLGFEVSRFEQCWFEMTGEAARRFRELAPDARGRGPYRYRVEMLARRAPSAEGRGFGHLGAYPCQIRASRFLSVQRVRTRR